MCKKDLNKKIQIYYDGSTIALFIGNDAHTVLVNGPHQNTENFFHFIQHSKQLEYKTLQNLNFEMDESTITELKKFLNHFEKGEFIIHNLTGTMNYVENSEEKKCELFFENEVDKLLIYTKPIQQLDKIRVDEYKSKIVNGESPTVVTYSKIFAEAELAHIYFVIEGNEVLKAYQELNLQPKIIAIVNDNEASYDEVDPKIVELISSYEPIKDSSYKYFY